jgi:hypothetical protein
MADNQHFRGFRWVSGRNGKEMPNPMALPVASGYQGQIGASTNIDFNPGDPVKRLSTGYVDHALPGESIWGICMDIRPYYDGTSMVINNRLPGNTVYGTKFERQSFIGVVPVGDSFWAIDCDDSSTATTYAAYLALVGENADHIFLTGQEPWSNCMLDISTHATATFGWRIENVSKHAKNADFSGNYVEVIVSCNEIQAAPFVTTGQ